jgi:hypothetical protein
MDLTNEQKGEEELYQAIIESIEDRLGDGWQGYKIRSIIQEIISKEIKKFTISKKKI